MTIKEWLRIMQGKHIPCEHPEKIENGKLMFWSLTRQKYVESACQPKGVKK